MRLCQAQRNIIEAIRRGTESPIVSNRALFSLHREMYHRRVKEFDKEMDYCKVYTEVCDIITWEELVAIAKSDSKTA